MDSLAASRADAKYKEVDFWSKSPHVSIMSSNDIRMPRASVDPNKLKIILKELKRLEALEQNKKWYHFVMPQYRFDLIHRTIFKMSRINFQSKIEGHRVEAPSNRDL